MMVSKTGPARKVTIVAILSFVGGVTGTLVGYYFASALRTSPTWIGPAIMVGLAALVTIGIMLLPVVLRAIRQHRNRTAA